MLKVLTLVAIAAFIHIIVFNIRQRRRQRIDELEAKRIVDAIKLRKSFDEIFPEYKR